MVLLLLFVHSIISCQGKNDGDYNATKETRDILETDDVMFDVNIQSSDTVSLEILRDTFLLSYLR